MGEEAKVRAKQRGGAIGGYCREEEIGIGLRSGVLWMNPGKREGMNKRKVNWRST